ncbi:3D domain-containing protein [Brevibacillus laterosporus]
MYRYYKRGTDVSVWKNDKIIAVDPSIIPLKSKVEVIVDGVSWGEYLADDTGGAIKGNKIDILMENDQKCRAFGRKQVLVRVKSWGDGRVHNSDGQIDHTISTYQFNRTTEKISYHKDFTVKKTALDPTKYTEVMGAEQYIDYDSHNKSCHLLGFKKTNAAGQVKNSPLSMTGLKLVV